MALICTAKTPYVDRNLKYFDNPLRYCKAYYSFLSLNMGFPPVANTMYCIISTLQAFLRI